MEELTEAVEENIEEMKGRIAEMFNDCPMEWVEEAYRRAQKEADDSLEDYIRGKRIEE